MENNSFKQNVHLALFLVDGLALLLLYGVALLLSAGSAGISDSGALLLCHCPTHWCSSRLAAVLLSDSLAALLKHSAALLLSDSVVHCGTGLLNSITAAATAVS
jgi:hypothetical protein